jgi:hypothetical protein
MLLCSFALCAACGHARGFNSVGGSQTETAELPVVFRDDFERGAGHWQPTDANAWKMLDTKSGTVYCLFQQSKYAPPYRSPLNVSLAKDVHVSDFAFEVKVQSTVKDYGHRDICLFFGYQDATHFYYVHLGKKTDDHANQIFIVNDAPRQKISTRTSAGTDWDDAWHHVKIVRRVDDGSIEVYFDDMKTPVMTATDKTFTSGQIGVGSFDDTGNFDDVMLRGVRAD